MENTKTNQPPTVKGIVCQHCGKTIQATDKAMIIALDNGYNICSDCLTAIHLQTRQAVTKHAEVVSMKKGGQKKLRPSDIKRALDRYIVGQNEAKKAIANAVYNHYKMIDMKERGITNVEMEKSNICLVGPTGCGKTALLKALSKFLQVPFAIGDCTSLTSAGFVGSDVETVIRLLIENAPGSTIEQKIEAAEHGIVYLDEVDKLGRKGENPSITTDPGAEGVQQALLKIIEGSEVEIPPKGQRKHPQQNCIKVNTENILFIVGGAFEGIEKIIAKRQHKGKGSIGFGSVGSSVDKQKDFNDLILDVKVEDLHQFGMMPEFLGRLPIICAMKQLNEEALVNILTEPKNALVKQYQELLARDDVQLEISKEALTKIAHMAIERGTGARGLRSIMEDTLGDTMFYLPDHPNITNVLVDVADDDELIITATDSELNEIDILENEEEKSA